MAISDTITSMYNNTSNAYTMIGYGTDLTGINKNLENLYSTIFEAFLESLRDSTTLYTNLPKISGNGTQITLNDTANAPMRITLKASELTQDATPTPSSPQDIHTISGDNSVVVEGKNLFDESNLTLTKVQEDGKECYKIAGTTGTTSNVIWNKELEPNTQYTISMVAKRVDYFNKVTIYYTDGTFSKGNFTNTSFETISTTSTANKTINKILIDTGDATAYNYIQVGTIQLEKGSTATTYEPYVSQTSPINLDTIEYCKIGNYEDEFILTSGKNLLNPNVATSNCSVDTTTGIITITANSTDTYIQGAYVYTDANKFLTLPSGNYYIKSTNSKVRISLYSDGSGLDTTNNQPITLSSETNFGGLRIRSTDSSSLQNVSFGIMISTTDTPYEPYGTNQWYLKKNIGKVVLDGTQTINNCIVSTGNSAMAYAYTELIDNYIGSSEGICNELIKSNTELNTNVNSNEEMFSVSTSWGGLRFYFDKTRLSEVSVAGFKTWLSTNNITIYYTLKTPTYTQITGTLETQLNNIYKNMLSYKGTTNVSQINNDLPFVINASAIEDLS